MGALCCKPSDEIDYSQGPELNHFHLIKLIGQGVFGKVRIVQHKKTKKKYALKYINKSICIKQKAIQNVILERNLLEQIDHPFIANLRYAFQDDETLFMALDLMPGGDLRQTQQQQETLQELQVRHHVATLALALNYLHNKKRIIHRDIKPENILLDKKGYAHLSDFNIATQFTPNQPLIWQMAGTIAYMAPEMLARKGYSVAVDWWSLGIVTFELLFGMRPFIANSKEALTHAVIHDPLVFPQNVYSLVSKECIDVISGLLDKSSFHRLGYNFDSFKNHPWFHGLDWDLLERKHLTPPIQPDKKSMKYNNNNIQQEENDLVVARSTTTTTKRIVPVKISTSGGTPVTEEARFRLQLEEEFLNFDFTTTLKQQQEEDEESMSFLEKRRSSLKRQYDRFRRRSQCSNSYSEIPPYSDE